MKVKYEFWMYVHSQSHDEKNDFIELFYFLLYNKIILLEDSLIDRHRINYFQ